MHGCVGPSRPLGASAPSLCAGRGSKWKTGAMATAWAGGGGDGGDGGGGGGGGGSGWFHSLPEWRDVAGG